MLIVALQGRVRLLKYAKESKTLFFTTTLQNSVQSYSVQHSKLLDPSHEHPSPPSVFALSSSSKFLLSTSTAPPTIHLTNLTLNMAPVLVRPKCSASAVVAADSHPERESLFILAFADGTAAVIDAIHFFHKHGKGERRARAAYSGSGGEISFVKGLHATGTSTGSSSTKELWTFDGYDPGTGTIGIGATNSGITAVAFVPGRRAVAVTVGADGRCCVVDFTQSTPDKAVLLKSWHLRRPATSLSIICYAQNPAHGQKLSHAAAHEEPKGTYCIAIGREDGRVLLFDLDGTPIGEQTLDSKGARIVDVEWAKIGDNSDGGGQPRDSPDTAASPKRRRLVDSALAHDHLQRAGTLPTSTMLVQPDYELDEDPPFDSSTPRKAPGLVPIYMASEGLDSKKNQKLKTVHARVTKLESGNATADRVEQSQRASIDGSDSTSQRPSAKVNSANQAGLAFSCSPPTVPPRPTPKPGGRLPMRRAQTSPYVAPNMPPSGWIPATSDFNSRRSGIIFGPRRQRSPGDEVFKIPASPNGPIPTEQLHDGSSDVAPAPPQHGVIVTPISSGESGRSFNTASSQVQSSEASTDTVVDWSTALSRMLSPSLLPTPTNTSPAPTRPKWRGHVSSSLLSTPMGTSNFDSPISNGNADSVIQWPAKHDTIVDWSAGIGRLPVPSLQPIKPTNKSPTQTKRKQKGHISLSVSSTSRETISPISPSSDELPNVVGQWPVGSSQESIPAVRILRPSGEVPVPTRLEQRGQITLPESTTMTDTITTVSSGSEGPIVEWTSLKMSPGIGEMDTTSSTSKYEPSATMAVLETYAASSPSPPKIPRRTVNSPSDFPELPSYIPNATPPLNPRISPGLPLPKLHTCTCSSTLESTLHHSLTTLRAEMGQQFEVQKKWFEDLVKAGRAERMTLAEENRLLRAELARSERGKGKKRSPRAMRNWEEYKLGTPESNEREI